MAEQELRELLNFYTRAQNIRNIDCGMLRRIGKTELLKKLMREHKAENPQDQIVLLTATADMALSYRQEIAQNIISYCLTQDSIHSARPYTNVAIFSDEIERAEELTERFRDGVFVAGFYSTSRAVQERTRREQEERDREEQRRMMMQVTHDTRHEEETRRRLSEISSQHIAAAMEQGSERIEQNISDAWSGTIREDEGEPCKEISTRSMRKKIKKQKPVAVTSAKLRFIQRPSGKNTAS